MSPRDFTYEHITINTGSSEIIYAFENRNANQAIALVRDAVNSGATTISTECGNIDIRIHLRMESLAFGNDCAIWEIRNPETSATLMTCYASASPNPELFAEIIDLARTTAEKHPMIPADIFIKNALVAPTDSWIATFFHPENGFFDFFIKKTIPSIINFNQCVAAFLLNR